MPSLEHGDYQMSSTSENGVRKPDDLASKIRTNPKIGSSLLPLQSSKAFVLQRAGEFTFEERLTPTSCSSREILVRIIATGVCGSDVSRLSIHLDMTGELSPHNANVLIVTFLAAWEDWPLRGYEPYRSWS